MKAWRGLWLLAMLCGAPTAHAEIYKYQDANGVILFSDRPMRGPYQLLGKVDNDHYSSSGATLSAAVPPRRPDNASYRERVERYTPLIDATARLVQLRPELLHAVIRAESSYNASAISRAGAVGLMQLMPGTAERYGVTDRYDPVENLRGGAYYLRDLLTLFNGDLRLALAGYNAGENAVIRNGYAIPPYAETIEYVRRVTLFYQQNQQPTYAAQ